MIAFPWVQCMYIYIYIYIYIHVHTVVTTPDIFMFTYYHCTSVYFVIEVHCTSNVLHSIAPYSTYKCKGNSHITMITVQSSTIVLLRSTVDYHLIKV